MRQAHRFDFPGGPYKGLTRVGSHGIDWSGRVQLAPAHILSEPLHWKKPQRVFVDSMSDLFHEALDPDQIADVFAVMAQAKQHTFQVLTKRPERMQRLVSERGNNTLKAAASSWSPEWPLPNVWLGVSVEDQATADERIPLLLQTPAAVRFVSYEPALGPVDFGQYGWLTGCDACCNGDRCPGPPDCTRFDRCLCPICHGTANGNNIDWLIVGGESGPGARPFDVSWARSALRQCREAGVPVFVKQLGAKPFSSDESDRAHFDRNAPCGNGWRLNTVFDSKGCDPAEWPEDLRVREFPG